MEEVETLVPGNHSRESRILLLSSQHTIQPVSCRRKYSALIRRPAQKQPLSYFSRYGPRRNHRTESRKGARTCVTMPMNCSSLKPPGRHNLSNERRQEPRTTT